MEMLDEESYKSSPAMKMAYKLGQLAMLDEIREIANNILIESQLNPFKIKNAYEEGQVYALNSMLENVMAFEQALEKSQQSESYDA